jgi:hypothetical protein
MVAYGVSSVTINQRMLNFLVKDEVGKAQMIYIAALLFYKRIKEVTGKANGSGRAYRRKNRFHVASSPGQPPTIDYGKLNKGILFDGKSEGVNLDITSIKKITGSKNSYEVVLPPLGLTLEYGTSRMRARPFIKNSLDFVLSNHLDLIIKIPLELVGFEVT